jgi:hypothetical protein
MREYRTPGHGREHDGDMSSMSKNKKKVGVESILYNGVH